MSPDNEESTEHFFTSFTDLLVGVIFLFMLLLMVFALNLKKPAPIVKPVIITEKIRADVLHEIERRMQERGLPVVLDLTNGVVRLPESLLFQSGKWELLPEGKKTVEALAEVLAEVLPCAAYATAACQWQVQPLKLDSVLVEGHTDSRPFSSAQGYTNWELSAFRAITVYKTMMAVAPSLDQAIINQNHQPLLGVSAYADRRPVAREAFDPNRRIDVRFNMRANDQQISSPTVVGTPAAALPMVAEPALQPVVQP